MKLLHIIHAYTPSTGGAQWLVQRVSEELQQRHGHQIRVLTTTARNIEHFWDPNEPSLPAGREIINGIEVTRLPVFNRLGTLRRLIAAAAYRLHLPGNDRLRTAQTGPWIHGMRQAILQSDADVVLAGTFPLRHMYDALSAARQAHKPIVLLGALHLADRWGYGRPMIYRAIRAADAYIALTDHERDVLVAQHHVSPDRIHVIGGGVDPIAVPSSEAIALRQRLNLGDHPLIASLGKHGERKRFDLLIAAMPAVWQRHPQAQLVIAGASSTYTERLRECIAQLDAQSRIQLLSDIDTATKHTLLAACNIFALPSGDESFGIAFIEAWAQAKPVIGANRPAIASLIHNQVDGLLYDFPSADSLAQALLTLLDNPAHQSQLGQAGQAQVQRHYTWPQIAAQYHALYTNLSQTP